MSRRRPIRIVLPGAIGALGSAPGPALGPALGLAIVLAACEAGAVPATPPISPGTVDRPREVNIIARDYEFLPQVVHLVPGETVLLHVINGGLEIHEAVIGDQAIQDAWEAAEAATAGAPPGPTPAVSVPPALAGLRVFVRSGERVDVVWTVPLEVVTGNPTGATGSPAPDESGEPRYGGWQVGCHIPGHYARGMQVPVRFVAPGELSGSSSG